MGTTPEPLCCPSCSCRSGAGSQGFGVRSYLHLFYEDCAFSRHQDDDDEDEEWKAATQIQEPCSWLLWRVTLAAGVLLAVTGAVALGAGLLLPPQIEGIGDGELLVVDQHAVGHNSALVACQLAGAFLLGLGATVLLGCIMIWRPGRADGNERGAHPAKESQTTWSVPNISPIHSMIPVSVSPTLVIQPSRGR